jgi:hypothetical protein
MPPEFLSAMASSFCTCKATEEFRRVLCSFPPPARTDAHGARNTILFFLAHPSTALRDLPLSKIQPLVLVQNKQTAFLIRFGSVLCPI